MSAGEATPLGEAGAVGAATTGVTAAALAGVSAACCAGPVLAPMIVAVLGAGGAAWAAGLKPYTPYLFVASGALLAFGFRTVRARARVACAIGDWRSRLLRRSSVAALWLSAAIWLASVALAIYATWFDNPFT